MKHARLGLKLLERAAEVEAALWRRLRFEADQSSRTPLFERYTPLAQKLARVEFRRRPAYGLERGDFEQLAFAGLLEAIDRYDPMRGAPFEAFARPRIRGAISDGILRSSESAAQYGARRRAEQDRIESIGASIDPHADPVTALADMAAALAIGIVAEHARAVRQASDPALDPYETLAWRDLELKVLSEIERLSATEQTVIKQHYLNEVPFTEIAKLLGVSKGRVAQLHRAAIMRLRTRVRRNE